ncbi:MAG TPA: hypothetical protein VEL28_03285 [Candidatus Binatia bacterium]|nr:hypothetical protein [Candidatus Binatia bacterium]
MHGADRIHRPGILHVTLVGAAVAWSCDAMHVHTGTISYPQPWLLGQAWWVAPGFAATFLTMAIVYLLLAQRVSAFVATTESRRPGTSGDFAETLAAFAFSYLLSGFGSREPALLSAIFLGSFLLRWWLTYERAWLLLLASLMAVGGMLGEGLLGWAGLAAYAHADVFHVPLWLGGLYLHGAFALRQSMRFFVYAER